MSADSKSFPVAVCLLSYLMSGPPFLPGSAAAASRPYVAAVYEHVHRALQGPFDSTAVRRNLAQLQRAAQVAASHGADILVFPEAAVLPLARSREQIAPLLEEVPDPEGRPNPCLERPGEENVALTNLSCTARKYAMYLVANLGRKERCRGKAGCPADGQYQFNTNVVFDREGTVMARYDKHHLFLEPAYDVPPNPELTVFTTDFGTFGTFTCFDILYPQAVELVTTFDLTGIVYPTMWFDEQPFLSSIQVQESFAIRHNVTLLAANIHRPELGPMGSGIYLGEKGAAVYTHMDDGKSRVLISPVGESSPPPLNIVVSTENETSKYRPFEFDLSNATLVALTESSGSARASLGDSRCQLSYRTDRPPRGYYLAAVNQIRSGGGGKYWWCEESCILVRCNDGKRDNCTSFPLHTETVFHSFRLEGHFRSPYIYPNVLSSYSELLPASLWKFERRAGRNSLESWGSIDRPVLSIGLYGRCYRRDPPYVP